jgi:hypothetical protein
MAEIKCPVCGTINDEMADACRSCRTLLKDTHSDGEQLVRPTPTEELLASLRNVGGVTPDHQSETGAEPADPGEELSGQEQRLHDVSGEQPEPAADDAQQDGEFIPDWLKELDAWQEEANATKQVSVDKTPKPLEEEQPVMDEELLPDWLKSHKPPAADQPLEKELPGQMISDEELSDWLSAYREQEAARADLPAEDPETLKPGNVIELPASFVDPYEKQAPPAGDETHTRPSEAHALPEWLSVADAMADDSADFQALRPSHPDEGADAASEDTSSEEIDLIEWLSDLRAEDFPAVFDSSELAQTTEGGQLPTTPPFAGEDLNEWIHPSGQAAGSDEQNGQPDGQPSRLPSLPEWMDDITPASSDDEPDQLDPAGEEPVQAEVPGWLTALQPDPLNFADQQTTIDESIVEESGPLAGIAGVLPLQDVSSLYRKPPVYSSQLQVSEKQRSHAAMLENMLDEEKLKVTQKRSKRLPSQAFVRVMVAVLLIAAVLLPLLGVNTPMLAALTDSTTAFNAGDVAAVATFQQAIEDLPVGSSVLLAVEYAPGFDGEMSIAALSTLERLMEREMRIAVLSTNPSGPALAEGLKLDALTAFPDLQERYNQRDWFINLGYLPGETLSLQELVRSPQQALRYGISAGLENRLVWDSAVLQNITRLEHFSMLVLVTDTAETGRVWIEQVQPTLQNSGRAVPFLVVSSAQAAPMLQPYVYSGQVQGMVTGMSGGLDLAERNGLQTDRSDALMLSIRLGAGLVVLLILLGIIIEGFSSLVGRNRSGQEA